jgi:hypothetical protein
MRGINAPIFVIKIAANIGTHRLHLILCQSNSVLTEKTFKASQRAGRWRELKNYHYAGIVDDIMAGAFDIRQSETILLGSRVD